MAIIIYYGPTLYNNINIVSSSSSPQPDTCWSNINPQAGWAYIYAVFFKNYSLCDGQNNERSPRFNQNTPQCLFGSLLLIRTKFDSELQERRCASVKSQKFGTKVSLTKNFFVLYSVCNTKMSSLNDIFNNKIPAVTVIGIFNNKIPVEFPD